MQKVIWITGASSGFGRDCALKLLQMGGYKVYVSSRRAELMQDLAQMGACVLPLDVCDDTSVNAACQTILEQENRIDALLANAGLGVYGTVESIDMADIHYQFDVNVFGVARCLKAVLPKMREQKSGRIVITESLAAHASCIGIGWYAASKHALKGMHTALRQELKHTGIQVIAIEPGRVKTDFWKTAGKNIPNNIKDYQQLTDNFIAHMDKPTYWQTLTTDSTVQAMIHALTAENPKTVYRTTKDAKLFPILMKFIPNWLYDKIVLSQLGVK